MVVNTQIYAFQLLTVFERNNQGDELAENLGPKYILYILRQPGQNILSLYYITLRRNQVCIFFIYGQKDSVLRVYTVMMI